MLFAARQAASLGVSELIAAEFGVARGDGLLIMQTHAKAIQKETGIRFSVVGFDLGSGLPAPKDHRDHPERWKEGEFPMEEAHLRKKLLPITSLILGDVAETVPAFVAKQSSPLGFVVVDLDYYSSTMSALRILTLPNRRILPLVPLYFDDIDLPENHCYAGELLAISDFNSHADDVKIDVWRGLKYETAFPESVWLDKMYMAHCLTAGVAQLRALHADFMNRELDRNAHAGDAVQETL
jgi:hypothetical protein